MKCKTIYMVNLELLKRYEYYLSVISEELQKIFEYQREYICCQNGCSGCCEKGMYPYSKLEADYIKLGYNNLPEEVKKIVKDNLIQLKKELEEHKGENFLHDCPFLIDGSCCVYQYRGIICRTFGLITENSEGKLTIPYCAGIGLNYSKVYDAEKKRILEEKVEELGYKVMPKAYNLSRENMMHLSLAKTLGIDFGESKMLIEWLLPDLLE